ncbi:MAG: SIS domain-containing protein [Gemmatimonadota bacterium]
MNETALTVSDAELLATGVQTLQIEAAGVAALRDRLGDGFVSAVRRILASDGRVVVTGLGKSGAIARKIASTLAGTGTPASFLHPTEAAHGDLGVLVSGDVLLVVSKSGVTDELATLLPAVRRIGAPIIAITGAPESPLARAADVALDASVKEEACPHDLAPTASSTAALAMGDAVAMAVMQARDMSPEDFARLHPGGALGRRLLWTVRDVMLTGAEVPRVAADDTLANAMMLIANQRGTVVVTDASGELGGVVTAGDLTRFAAKHREFLERQVHEAMNDDPKWTGPERRATDALASMEAHGIMAMPVLEGRFVVGIVHLHDLLRAGVRP